MSSQSSNGFERFTLKKTFVQNILKKSYGECTISVSGKNEPEKRKSIRY